MIPQLDVHCHPASYEDAEVYVHERLKQGIRHLGAAASSPRDWSRIIELSRRHDEVWGGLGIHPWQAGVASDDELDEALSALESLVSCHACVRFIGECGLDACRPDMARQKALFEAQIDIARRHGLMIVVHCVKAWHEMPRLLKRYDDVLFPGFSGSVEIQREILSRGGFVSLGRAMLRKTPPFLLPELIRRAFLETDDDAVHPAISLKDVAERIEGFDLEASESLAIARFTRA